MSIRPIVAAALLLAAAHPAHAQRDFTTWGINVENDTWTNSDTGYTNGIRLSWSVMRYRPILRTFANYNLGTALDRLLPLRRLGILPDSIDARACVPNGSRGDRRKGACTTLNLAVAQVMYTPDTLASLVPQVRDQPYAGFLYATVGVTTWDSPSARDTTHWLAFTESSHQLLFGVTGQAAHAEDTQSLAHWTWSPGSHRPLGWHTQLRQSLQLGLMSDLAFRPRRFEFCRDKVLVTYGCDGTGDDQRWLDITPHTELVASTHMVRASGGVTTRLGVNIPEGVGGLRIPVSKGRGRATWERWGMPTWGYLFGNAEARWVPYNMFIEGGLADGGPTGWRTIRQVTPRRGVNEVAAGLAFGNTHMSARGQLAFRTPEYDVIGYRRSRGWHGYGSFMLAIHSRGN